MAEQIISPGVFTRENDLTFLPQGVGQIGAAVVGPTVKGPAFVPTVVRSFAEYERKFGGMSRETYVPQTVREYLKNAGSVTVCRVLAGGGYSYVTGTNDPVYILSSGSADSGATSGFVLLGALFPSKATSKPDLGDTTMHGGGVQSGVAPVSITSSFAVTLNGTNATSTTLSASLDKSNTNYIFKQLGDNPNNSKSSTTQYAGTPAYSYLEFKDSINSVFTTATATIGGVAGTQAGTGSFMIFTTGSGTLSFNGLSGTDEKYSYASTPFITSQFLDLAKNTKELFKFHTLVHGSECNKHYKISIQNLREPGDVDNVEQYSTFSVLIRKYGDTDRNPIILEQFNNCNLNPDSPNYISRIIGDRYPQYNDTLNKVEMLGDYPNISEYVRVEVSPAVNAGATSPKLSPKGFKALVNPIPTSSIDVSNLGTDADFFTFPSCEYEGVQKTGTDVAAYSSKGFLGWKTTEKAIDNDNWIKPLPSVQENNVAGDFNVENFTGHPSSSLFSGSLSASIDTTATNGPTANQLKFTVPFQGGEDGIRPDIVRVTGNEDTTNTVSGYTTATNLFGFDLSGTDKVGYKGYTKSLNILSNQDEYDINMLVLPGVTKRYHSSVTSKGIDMCEERGDAFYVMDLSTIDSSVNQALSTVDGLDSNYAAVYYPWVKVLDTSINKPVLVPPSVIVPGAIAASDNIAAEWFAPAGLNRGILGNVLEAKIRLNQADRDKLYDAKINPIATFPQTGVCIWGQKTLQERPTALDRINVRRLLITLKKFIASSSRYLVFEQNTIATRNRFLNIVNPYLESVQQRQGLFAFRVVMDESNNTPDVIDRNQLVGGIYLQPARTAEFIVLDFNILPTGATFDTGGGAGGTGGGGY